VYFSWSMFLSWPRRAETKKSRAYGSRGRKSVFSVRSGIALRDVADQHWSSGVGRTDACPLVSRVARREALAASEFSASRRNIKRLCHNSLKIQRASCSVKSNVLPQRKAIGRKKIICPRNGTQQAVEDISARPLSFFWTLRDIGPRCRIDSDGKRSERKEALASQCSAFAPNDARPCGLNCANGKDAAWAVELQERSYNNRWGRPSSAQYAPSGAGSIRSGRQNLRCSLRPSILYGQRFLFPGRNQPSRGLVNTRPPSGDRQPSAFCDAHHGAPQALSGREIAQTTRPCHHQAGQRLFARPRRPTLRRPKGIDKSVRHGRPPFALRHGDFLDLPGPGAWAAPK